MPKRVSWNCKIICIISLVSIILIILQLMCYVGRFTAKYECFCVLYVPNHLKSKNKRNRVEVVVGESKQCPCVEIRQTFALCVVSTQASFYTMRYKGRDSASGIDRKLSIICPGATTCRLNNWMVAYTDIGVFTDFGSCSDPISCHMSRYRVFRVTRYRVMSDETRYRVTLTPILTPICGATRYRVIMSPISYTVIGFNIGTNIGIPDIGACIT
jgi:hypothetical protein